MNPRHHNRKAQRLASFSGLAALLLTVPGMALASPSDLYYQRSVMAAADLRCGLFSNDIRQALAASQAQARNAALRAETSAEALDQTRQRAEAKVAAVGCASPDIALAAGRVRDGFAGFAKLSSVVYPGDLAGWTAARRPADGWVVAQTTVFGFDKLRFGVAAPGMLTADGRFADGATPFTARLVLRDADRTAGPYLDRRSADSKGVIPLAARTPPRFVTRVFAASDRTPAAAGVGGWVFRFPAAAAEALAALDPREAAVVEFVFTTRDGESVRRAYVEVGDFAAARAFLKVATR